MLDKSGAVLRLGQFWDYENKKWAKTEDFLGISAFPIDWDDDGDFDLLLGANGGRVFLRLNEGTKEKPAFAVNNIAVRAGGKDMSVPGGHAMPVAADWDGDGLFDLVSGSNSGAVHWFRNTGKKGARRRSSWCRRRRGTRLASASAPRWRWPTTTATVAWTC